MTDINDPDERRPRLKGSPVASSFETERLLLRQPSEADAVAIAEMDADPEVMRYIGDGTPVPFDPEAARGRITRARRQWAERGYGNLSVIVKETGQYAGWVMLAEPLFLPEVLPAVEIGWRFRREHWGRGYATEAAKVLLDYGLTGCGLDRILSIRFAGNIRSKRIMDKLGFRHEFDTVVPGTGERVAVHAITRGSGR